jgi:hypothetical protein
MLFVGQVRRFPFNVPSRVLFVEAEGDRETVLPPSVQNAVDKGKCALALARSRSLVLARVVAERDDFVQADVPAVVVVDA